MAIGKIGFAEDEVRNFLAQTGKISLLCIDFLYCLDRAHGSRLDHEFTPTLNHRALRNFIGQTTGDAAVLIDYLTRHAARDIHPGLDLGHETLLDTLENLGVVGRATARWAVEGL